MDFRLLAAAFMGWALGANDAANVFGLAIATRVIRTAVALGLTAAFVVVGAITAGYAGVATYGRLMSQTPDTAFLAALAAAGTTTLMTVLGLPISTTQAVVGAMVGLGWLRGGDVVNWWVFLKLGVAWALAPLGAVALAYLFYRLTGQLVERFLRGWALYDLLIKVGFFVIGTYGAYSLGANNVANISGVWVQAQVLSPQAGVWLGSLAIALGVLTYSRKVIVTVGQRLTVLDPFSAFVAMFSEALTLHIYALLGIPVSASQAIVGAVLGIGLVKGVRTIEARTVRNILFAWFGVPLISAALAALAFALWQALFV